MNTTQIPSAAVPAQITEADVVAFLKRYAQSLSKETGIEYATITLEVNATRVAAYWTTYVDGGSHATRVTLAESFNAQVDSMAPQCRVKTLREQAEKLLAEADQLQNGRAA
jgi:hypothetical protein